MAKRRVIEIDPVTRVEGHGKVSIHLDEHNRVHEARLHIVEFRGFERFIKGRPLWEVPVIVQRLCGICPVSHHLAASKAMDQIVGARQLTPTAEKMRRLMHYGQIMQSHVLHFFHLCAPDLLFGFGAKPERRNIFALIKEQPELATQAVMMRKYGQELIRLTAGKKIHGTNSVPGGMTKNLSIQERDSVLVDIDQMLEWSRRALTIARDYILEHQGLVDSFAHFPSNHMSMLREDGALDLYDGKLRAIDAGGNLIFNQLDYGKYHEVITEEVRPWSYMKFPFIRERGRLDGWYRVGPLSRLNTAGFVDTPEAGAAHRQLMELSRGKPNHSSLTIHWARMIEVLHCLEKIKDLLYDDDLQRNDLLVKGARQEEGVGVIEAPRGTLIHHYRVDENDLVSFCNLIVSTTHNNEAMNRAVAQVAESYISRQPKVTEAMLNHVEVAIRAYDPCLSCATHAIGQMPLAVEIYSVDDVLIDTGAQHL